VSRAIAWLNDHFQEPLRINSLAREVNLSVWTLHHRFKAVTSMGPCNTKSSCGCRRYVG